VADASLESRVATMLKEKLNHHAVRIQVPIGAEDRFIGIVDPIIMRAFYYEGKDGDILREADIPAELQALAEERRHEIIEKVSEVDDLLAEKFLADESISND
jgi:elongation factor G